MVGIDKLERALKSVKDTYPDFVEAGLRIARKNPENGHMLLAYVEKYPELTTSDIIVFITEKIYGIKPVIPDEPSE